MVIGRGGGESTCQEGQAGQRERRRRQLASFPSVTIRRCHSWSLEVGKHQQPTHSCCSEYFDFANLWRKRSRKFGIDLHCQRQSQHQAQQQKLFMNMNQFCYPPKKDLEK